MKEARAGSPIRVGDVTIVPLERVAVHHGVRKAGLWAYGCKEPVGVVVVSAGETWAFDVRGERVPLETYIEQIDNLRSVLASL
jgi:hypothetical protein